jgi:hypothetical protein
MKFNWKAYIAIGIVGAVSALAIVFLPIEGISEVFIASPVALSLCAAVFQIIRDDAAHQKQIEANRTERLHALSVSSHMAIKAFDKHAEFAEEYMEGVKETISILWSEGTTENAYTQSRKLTNIRVKYAVWIAKETNQRFRPFEKALKTIGLNEKQAIKRPAGNEFREKLLDESSRLWHEILEVEPEFESESDSQVPLEIGHSDVLDRIQELLGINELTSLRLSTMKEANQSS